MLRHLHRSTPAAVRRRRLFQLVLGVTVAGGLLLNAGNLAACDYCETGEPDLVVCDSCAPKVKRKSSLPSPGKAIYNTLDAFAGGIEKVLGFDKCNSGICGTGGCGCDNGTCDEPSCDDGCDSALQSELMMGAPPAYIPDMYAPPMPSHTMAPAPMAPPMSNAYPSTDSTPIIDSAPMAAPIPAQPQLRMGEPTIVSPQSQPYEAVPSQTEREQYNEYNTIPDSNDTTPRESIQDAPLPPGTPNPVPDAIPDVVPDAIPNAPTEVPAPVTPPASREEGGSLFDSLDDPFSDDEVRALPRPYRTIKPSKYRSSTNQPNPYQPSNYRPKSKPVQLHSPQARANPAVHDPVNPASRVATRGGTSRAASNRSMASRSSKTAVQRAAYGAHQGHSAPSPRVGSLPYQNNVASMRQQTTHATHHRSANQKAASAKQVTHHHASQQRSVLKATSRAAHQPHLRPAPKPPSTPFPSMRDQIPTQKQPAQPRISRGQRHSNAGYSGYGHTTNR